MIISLPELTREAFMVLRTVRMRNPEINKAIVERAEDICYDRFLCRQLEIDYCRITNGDFWRIELGFLERDFPELYNEYTRRAEMASVQRPS